MNPKVRVALAFIEDNLGRDVYVAEVAERVGLSSSRLCHLFKSELAMPVTQYLTKARLEKACELLETSFKQIKEIGFEVGYNDPAYFEREFKKTYDLSPLQYRANYLALLGQKKSRQDNRRIL